MRSPRIRGDFIFAPASVAARLWIHLEKNEIREAALAEAPGGAKTGDAATDDDDRDFFDVFGRGERGAVTQEMPHLEGIVDERTFDLLFTFEGKAGERRTAKTEKLAATQLQ